MKVLITAGGTREPIDGVRFITNFSTGATGAAICDYLRSQGHDVLFLGSRDSKLPMSKGPTLSFETFYDLDTTLKNTLCSQNFDAILHLAAVSDFSIDSIEINGIKKSPGDAQKISSQDNVSLHLKKNKKIVADLKSYSINPKITVVAFKLTHTRDEHKRNEAVQKLLQLPSVDFVVHNELTEIEQDTSKHIAKIHNKNKILQVVSSKLALAKSLEKLIQGELK